MINKTRTAMQQQYRHQAVPYQGQDQFLSCCAAMVDSAGARDQQVLFLVSAAKADALRHATDGHEDHVAYIDMDEHGRNPARLLSLLDGFRAGAAGRYCVGVNEPVGGQQSVEVAREAQLGESVLNSARLHSWPMSVLCLYDSAVLDADAMAAMRRSHPEVAGTDSNPAYDPQLVGSLFAETLPPAPPDVPSRDIRAPDTASAREFVRSNADGLPADRREDLVLAANEVVTNSFRHAGGQCRAAVWADPMAVVVEVRDDGHITDPLVGRLPPAHEATAGRGLWLANHLCDLVQIRSSPDGTTVRLHMGR